MCARSSRTAAAYWLEHFQPCGLRWCFVHCHSVFISVTVSLRVNASYSPLVCMFVCSVTSVFAELNCFSWPLADLCYLWKGGGGVSCVVTLLSGFFLVCCWPLSCWNGVLLSITLARRWGGRVSCTVSLTMCLWCVLKSVKHQCLLTYQSVGKGGGGAVLCCFAPSVFVVCPHSVKMVSLSTGGWGGLLEWCVWGGGECIQGCFTLLWVFVMWPPVCWNGVFLCVFFWGGARCTRCSSLLMCWGGGGGGLCPVLFQSLGVPVCGVASTLSEFCVCLLGVGGGGSLFVVLSVWGGSGGGWVFPVLFYSFSVCGVCALQSVSVGMVCFCLLWQRRSPPFRVLRKDTNPRPLARLRLRRAPGPWVTRFFPLCTLILELGQQFAPWRGSEHMLGVWTCIGHIGRERKISTRLLCYWRLNDPQNYAKQKGRKTFDPKSSLAYEVWDSLHTIT